MREGIRTLEAALTRHGHDVYSVAPHTEQSAKSHSMTVLGSVTIWKHDDHHYSLEGTPADCIIYSLKSGLLREVPEVIIGGINHGYNLSSDTIYSGTCGVARQGAMYGIPSIAISCMCDGNGEYDFETPAEYLASNIEYFSKSLIGAESFLNINFPPQWNGKVEKSSLGVIHYDDQFTVKERGNKINVKTSGCNMIAVPSSETIFISTSTRQCQGNSTNCIVTKSICRWRNYLRKCRQYYPVWRIIGTLIQWSYYSII